MKLNCIIIDDEPHAISEMEDLIISCPQLELAKSFLDISAAISFLQQNGPVHFIFSDINMPVINGIDAAKILNRYCRCLVFVSAHREYAFDAFGVSASAYLTKPVSTTVFLDKIDELITQTLNSELPKKNNDDILFVKGSAKNSFTKINYNDIIFIEGLLNYVVIHTVNDRHITYMGLKEILKRLEHTSIFFRINKSIIISTRYIGKIDGNTIRLTNKNEYTIGNTYKSAFHEYITKRTLNNV